MTAEYASTHRHTCPECGTESWHETVGPVACANAAAASGGVAVYLCDLCWGMRRPAREPRRP